MLNSWFMNPFNGIESIINITIRYPSYFIRQESIQWNWKSRNPDAPHCAMAVNPFNGIERNHVKTPSSSSPCSKESIQWNWKCIGSQPRTGPTIRRIHSMELKEHPSPSPPPMPRLRPNPFNGIERWPLFIELPRFRLSANPFNGIESILRPPATVRALHGNPFNGIESHCHIANPP